MTTLATLAKPLTLDDFLELPEEKPYREYLRGQVMEKSMPTNLHGRSVARLITTFTNHLDESGEGVVDTEVRHALRDQDWVFLPDIELEVPARTVQARGAVESPPEFAVEVLSPDDRAANWLERVQLYMEAGTQLLWVVDPEEETISVFTPGQRARVYRAGDALDAEPVLHDFSLDVGAFFARVRTSAGQ